MKTWKERGPYGRWLVTARQARGMNTTAEARDALAAAGIAIGASTYAAYESGSKTPSRNDLPRLEAFWGPFSDPLGATESPDDLLSALRDQTAALTALVDRIDLMLAAHSTASTELMRAIGVVASGQAPPGTPSASERAAPSGTER